MKLFNKKAINKLNFFKYKNHININKSAIFFKTITSKNTAATCINNNVWRNYCNETTSSEVAAEETSSTEITQQQEIFAEKVVDSNKATLAQQKELDSDFITSLNGFNTVESPHFTEIALAIHRYQQTEEYEKLSDKEKIRMRILKAQLVIQSRIPFDVKNAYAVPLEESTKKVQISFVGLDKRMAVSMNRIKQAMDLCPGLIKISGIVPLPKKIKRMALLSSPFKYGRARENYALIKYRRLIQYWTDSDNQKKFLEFMKRFMEPTLACKVTEFNYFPIDEYFTRDQYLFDGKHESLVTPENVRVSSRSLQNK